MDKQKALCVAAFTLGLTLLLVVPTSPDLPDGPFPRELHRSAGWFADWEPVHRLAERPEVSARVMAVGSVALACFAFGVVPRVSYAIAVLAITARGLVLLLHTSAHDWGLPLVILW